VVRGGRVCIDFNGERGNFFRSFKGLRQGDPLSPLLFNLVADALSAMLSRASSAGLIQGLVPHLIDGGITHLQYADDTVLLLQFSVDNLTNVRMILSCYEAMSGLKINFEKSEVFTIGLSGDEQQQAATILGCKIGTFPLRYLGMPVSYSKITKTQLRYVSDKAEKRLSTWQCDYLSSGGKSILIESCLSSIPMYTMGVYELYEGNYQLLDSIRSRFYWQGTGKKRKYHMVKWEALSRPKEFGGLGFLDVRVMNKCLLAKWIDKLEKGNDSLCCSLLRKKYLGQRSIFQINNRKGSQFWRSLLEMRFWYQKGRKMEVRGGHQTRLWHDCWLGDCPLKVRFHKLYQIAVDQDLEVAKAFVQGQWTIPFRRHLNDNLRMDWNELLGMLNEVQLSEGTDTVRWILEKSGSYTTSSLYKMLTYGGVTDTRAMLI
jgi:hypothetical protein